MEQSLLFVLSAVECDLLAYIGGLLLKSLVKSINNRKGCKQVPLGDDTEQYNNLIRLKEYS